MHLEKVNSIMSRDVITLSPQETLKSAIEKMNLNNVSCIVVGENKKPLGILTERDIIWLVANNVNIDARRLMTVMKSPVIAIYEELEIPEAADRMVINNLRRLVVVDKEQNVVGIVTQTDIIKNFSIDSFISSKKVEQIMKRKVISVKKGEAVSKAIEFMVKNRISCIVVIEDNKAEGIITERDITKAIAKNNVLNNVEKIMSSPVFTINGDMNLYDATKLMDEHRLRGLVVADSEGDVTGIITKTDIVNTIRADYVELLKNILKEKSQALIESERKYRTLVEQSSEGIMTIQEGVIKFVNPTLIKILSYKEEDIIGKDVLRFLYPDDRELLLENLSKLSESKGTKSPLELRLIQKNGEGIYMEVLLNSIQYEGNPAILATLRDITERKKTEEELKRLIITDDLTGLFNQRYFYIQLTKEIERVKRSIRPLSIFLIDIDKFKDFNDKYGHWEGDYVLKKMGEMLMKNIRDVDMAFRYGGEEFIVVLPETKLEDAMIVAERIKKAVSQAIFYPFTLDGQPDVVKNTVSIGVTEFHLDDDIKSFLKRADNAMYQAKKKGRNMVVFLM
ncbi:MAG: CBS domain-containing protein [Nitrospirota bacterium]